MFSEQYLVLDYGTTHIKGMLFKQVFGGVSILRSEVLEIVLAEDDVYEYNIIRFLQSFFPEQDNLVVSLPIHKLHIRDIVIPLNSEKQILEVLPFEVENYIHHPIESIEVRGNIWRLGEENSNIISFSILKEELSRSLEPFFAVNNQLKSISIDPYNLSTIIRHYQNKSITDEIVAQLDIGGKVTIFNILVKGSLAHSRYFPNGGYYLTESIAKYLDTSFQRAEELKTSIDFSLFESSAEEREHFIIKFSITEEQLSKIVELVLEWIDELCQEIIRSLHVLDKFEKPSRIFLSGGSSKFIALENRIQSIVGLTIERYNFIQEVGEPELITALSASYHYRLNRKNRIDFFIDDLSTSLGKNSFNYKEYTPHITVFSLASIIFLIAFTLGIFIDKRKIKNEQIALKEKYKNGFGKELPPEREVIEAAVENLKLEQNKSEIVRLFLSKEGILELMMDMTTNFPNREFEFVLDQFSFKGTGIEIAGRVNELADLNKLQSSLERSSKFKGIEIINNNFVPNTDKLRVSFRMKLDLKVSEKNVEKSEKK